MRASRLSRAAVASSLLALASSCALAAPLQVTLSNNPTTCQPMHITWDTSSGTAPWTVTVAPLGHVPISVSLPANYMSGNAWSWDWNIPGYTSVSSVIVAVADSTGGVSGTSSLATLTKAGSCSAPAEHLDFVWYPPRSAPKQCDDWRLTVQEDHGNLGLKLPVDLLVLPENDVPTRLRLADNRHTVVDWTVNYARGTQFAIASFDAGSSGTGGVGGDIYTVRAGRSNTCINEAQSEAVAGLAAATSTAARVAGASPTAASHRMATSRSSTPVGSTARSTPTANAAANAAASAEKPTSSAGIIGGAVGGVLGALVIGGLAFFLYRKQRNTKGPDEYGVYPATEKRSIFGGFGSGRSADRAGFTGGNAGGDRFGASTDQQGGISPFVTGRASPYRFSRPNTETVQANERIVARHGGSGHSSSISLHRGNDSFGESAGHAVTHANGVHSAMPDDTLYPPPLSVGRNLTPNGGGMSGAGMMGGWNRDRSDSGSSMQQHDPFRNPVNVIDPLPVVPSHQEQYQQSALHAPSRPSPSASTFPLPTPSSAPQHRTIPSTTYSNDPTQPPFDPYTHTTHLNTHFNPHEGRALTPTSTSSGPRYADPKESAARFRNLDAQLRTEREKLDSDSDSDEEGLPYM